MATLRSTSAAWMLTRLCPRCGYDGWELQDADVDVETAPVFECPSCHADLYARPAKSYAEMEGFDAIVHIHRTHAGGRTCPVSGRRRKGLMARFAGMLRMLGRAIGLRRPHMACHARASGVTEPREHRTTST